jgi:hypothetical protein
MLEDIRAAIAPREERLELGGKTLVVKELACAADVAAFSEPEDMVYKLLVRCAFDESGALVFTDADIPMLKAGARRAMLPLIEAVNRVNGFDLEANVKNSEAAPA